MAISTMYNDTAADAATVRRQKDSMKSTWRDDRSQWNLYHWAVHLLNLYPTWSDKPIPVHQKTDPIATLPEWSVHIWIISHALWPMLIQWGIQWHYGKGMHPFSAFLLYTLCMQLNSIHQLWILRRLGHIHGFLDGDKHARDGVPDTGVAKTFYSLEMTTTIRPMIAVIMAYRRQLAPSLSWWLPVELALYSVVLDGFFYLYHRSCHEFDGLWKYHRTHHLTKHPNPLLSSYADSEQEFLEIALIPFLTWATLKYVFGLPMGFNDWWICHQYIIFSEAFGHSGVRLAGRTASFASPILLLLGAELQIEDHDLHHRKGWRKSSNYGKQTRFWDKLFGTCGDRVEAVPQNISKDNWVPMPLI